MPRDLNNRHRIHASLVDAVAMLRYQHQRWQWTPTRTQPANDPANFVHAWRALADDLDAALVILNGLRDIARTEQDRLTNLNGDTPRDSSTPYRP